MATDKFRSVRGEVPKKRDFIKWSPEKILALMQFSIFFMKMGKYQDKEQMVYDVSVEKLEIANVSQEPYWEEFMARLHKKGMRTNSFRLRLQPVIQGCGGFLRENPHFITDEMRELIKDNARWNWCLTAFEEGESKIGGTIVIHNPANTVIPGVKNAQSALTDTKTPLAQFHQGLLKMTSIFNNLLKGIPQADINEMSAEKRIKLANNLLHTLAKAVTTQQNTKVFNTIVVNKAGRDDLEKSILEYSESQNVQEN